MENRLWNWFELSYASFLTLPRVLMHEMPEEWQDKMADLLEEYDEFYNFSNLEREDDVNIYVQARKNGKICKLPKWLINYRYPNRNKISGIKTRR